MAYSRLEDLREQIYGSSKRQRKTRAKILAALVIHKWRNEASKRLTSTLGAYLASIDHEKITEDTVVVSLPEGTEGHHAFIARMVEFGYGAQGVGSYGGPYDMRTSGQVLNRIPKSKTATGMQRVVAFNFGKSQAKSRVTSGDIDDAFLKSAGGGAPIATVRPPQGKTSWGTSLSPSLSRKLKPHHAATAAAGMVFSKSKNSNSKGSAGASYTMFRTVSDPRKPGSLSWISKGVEPRDIARRYVVPALPDIIREAGII